MTNYNENQITVKKLHELINSRKILYEEFINEFENYQGIEEANDILKTIKDLDKQIDAYKSVLTIVFLKRGDING